MAARFKQGGDHTVPCLLQPAHPVQPAVHDQPLAEEPKPKPHPHPQAIKRDSSEDELAALAGGRRGAAGAKGKGKAAAGAKDAEIVYEDGGGKVRGWGGLAKWLRAAD